MYPLFSYPTNVVSNAAYDPIILLGAGMQDVLRTQPSLSNGLWSRAGLDQRFLKGPDGKYFRLCGPQDLCSSYSTQPCGAE